MFKRHKQQAVQESTMTKNRGGGDQVLVLPRLPHVELAISSIVMVSHDAAVWRPEAGGGGEHSLARKTVHGLNTRHTGIFSSQPRGRFTIQNQPNASLHKYAQTFCLVEYYSTCMSVLCVFDTELCCLDGEADVAPSLAPVGSTSRLLTHSHTHSLSLSICEKKTKATS